MRIHEDLTVIDCGWNPPSDWLWGVCQDCRKPFQPKLLKQYYCYTCRNEGKSTKQTNTWDWKEWQLDNPIGRAAKARGFRTFGEFISEMKVSRESMNNLMLSNFPTKKHYIKVYRMEKLLNRKPETLYPKADRWKVNSYAIWKYEHEEEIRYESRHTLP